MESESSRLELQASSKPWREFALAGILIHLCVFRNKRPFHLLISFLFVDCFRFSSLFCVTFSDFTQSSVVYTFVIPATLFSFATLPPSAFIKNYIRFIPTGHTFTSVRYFPLLLLLMFLFPHNSLSFRSALMPYCRFWSCSTFLIYSSPFVHTLFYISDTLLFPLL